MFILSITNVSIFNSVWSGCGPLISFSSDFDYNLPVIMSEAATSPLPPLTSLATQATYDLFDTVKKQWLPESNTTMGDRQDRVSHLNASSSNLLQMWIEHPDDSNSLRDLLDALNEERRREQISLSADAFATLVAVLNTRLTLLLKSRCDEVGDFSQAQHDVCLTLCMLEDTLRYLASQSVTPRTQQALTACLLRNDSCRVTAIECLPRLAPPAVEMYLYAVSHLVVLAAQATDIDNECYVSLVELLRRVFATASAFTAGQTGALYLLMVRLAENWDSGYSTRMPNTVLTEALSAAVCVWHSTSPAHSTSRELSTQVVAWLCSLHKTTRLSQDDEIIKQVFTSLLDCITSLKPLVGTESEDISCVWLLRALIEVLTIATSSARAHCCEQLYPLVPSLCFFAAPLTSPQSASHAATASYRVMSALSLLTILCETESSDTAADTRSEQIDGAHSGSAGLFSRWCKTCGSRRYVVANTLSDRTELSRRRPVASDSAV